jgi:tetratricopeptide (TPR) repeat protein
MSARLCRLPQRWHAPVHGPEIIPKERLAASMNDSVIIHRDPETGFAFPSSLSDWTVVEPVKHYRVGNGYSITYEHVDEFADVFVYNKGLVAIPERVLLSEFLACKQNIVQLQGTHGYRVVKDFADTQLHAGSGGLALRFLVARCFYIEDGRSIDSYLLMAVAKNHFLKLRISVLLKSPEAASRAVVDMFVEELSGALLGWEPSPLTSPTSKLGCPSEITLANFKTYSRPFGNKLRLPSRYLEYLLFRDKYYMLRYYGALKQHILDHRPPKVIEVTLGRLSDHLPLVRTQGGMPHAILWPVSGDGDDAFYAWGVHSVQEVNGMTHGIGDYGSSEYEEVLKCVTEIYDWDVFFPVDGENRAGVAEYLRDDPQNLFPVTCSLPTRQDGSPAGDSASHQTLKWFDEGCANIDSGRLDQAVDCFNRALEHDPKFAEAWNNRGFALKRLGRREEALISFERAIESDFSNISAWQNKGDALKDLGRTEEALSVYRESLDVEPRSESGWLRLGESLWDVGRKEEAQAAYARALDWLPGDLEIAARRGEMLALMGRHEEAVSVLDDVIKADPKRPRVWDFTFEALCALGRDEQALVAIERATDEIPNDGHLWTKRGLLLATLGRRAQAHSAADRALQLDASIGDAWYVKAQLLGEEGREQERAALLCSATRGAPEHSGLWFEKGALSAKEGNLNGAVDELSRSIALNPNNAVVWTIRSDVLRNLGRRDEALSDAERACRIDPRSPYAWFTQGMALGELGRRRQALEALDRALQIEPNFETARQARSRLAGGAV